MIKKWEYATGVFQSKEGDMTVWLNGYGEQGWEVVYTSFNPSNINYHFDWWTFIFKRPINS